MARIFEYKADDKTYDLNNRLIGIIGSGVYRGFRLYTDEVVDHKLVLKPDTGAVMVGIDQVVSSPMHILITPQGTVIRETGNLEFVLTSGDPDHDRIDTIYCRHEYVATEGGVAPTFLVEEGTPATPAVAPALPDPEINTLIGHVLVPLHWEGDPTELTWARAESPSIADDPTYARTFLKNVFDFIQTLHGVSYQHHEADMRDGVVAAIDPLNVEGSLYEIMNVYIAEVQQVGDTEFDLTHLSGLGNIDQQHVFLICRKKLKIKGNGNIKTLADRDFSVPAYTLIEFLQCEFLGISGKSWLFRQAGIVTNEHGDNVMEGDSITTGDAYSGTEFVLATQTWVAENYTPLTPP